MVCEKLSAARSLAMTAILPLPIEHTIEKSNLNICTLNYQISVEQLFFLFSFLVWLVSLEGEAKIQTGDLRLIWWGPRPIMLPLGLEGTNITSWTLTVS